MYPPTHNADCNCDVYDFTKAHLTQWLHQDSNTVSDIVEREKEPLENAVYYHYLGQPDCHFIGSSRQPETVSRLLDDGSSQYYQYVYNSLSKVTKYIDVLQRVTSFVYASNNIDILAVYQRNPNGTSMDPDNQHADLIGSYVYDPADPPHLPHSYTDAAGQTTVYTYNSHGQVLTVENPRHEVTTYTYGDGTDPNVPAGYLASITSPDFKSSNALTSFTYDNAHRVQTVTNSPDNYSVTTDYDDLDRPTQITYPDGTTQQFQYTDASRGMTLDLTASKDRDDRWTNRHYDSNRHMDSMTDPLGQQTLYDWCSCGALASITDPNGNITSFARDLQGRVYQKIFADNSAINYTYESTTSRLKSMTDALNQTTNYSYFVDNDIEQISYANANNLTPTVSYAYDLHYNRVTSMMDGIGTTSYLYYPSGVQGGGKLYQASGPFPNSTITYSYDELGRMTTQNINGTPDTTVYDSLGRPDTTDNPLGHFSRTYENDVTPRLQTLNYPNGQTANYVFFDNSGDRRLQTLVNAVGPTNLSQHSYTYDPEGQIQTWNKILGANETDLSLGYDDAKQLLSVNDGTSEFDYGYDSAGNRLGASAIVPTRPPRSSSGSFNYYTANNLNQLDSMSHSVNSDPPSDPVAITYDANGNMTYDGSNQTFEWDAANRLVATNYIDTGKRTKFSYDGLGRRVMIQEGPGMTAVVQPMTVQPAELYSLFTSAPFPLPGGDYTITFQGLDPNGDDSSALVDLVELNGVPVSNGSFETPNVQTAGNPGDWYKYNPTGGVWNFQGDTGITANGSDFTAENANAPDGSQVGFVQKIGVFSQTLSLSSGSYVLSFYAAQRVLFQSSSQSFRVTVESPTAPFTIKTYLWSGNTIAEERDATGATVIKRFFAEGEQKVGGSHAGNYYYSRDHLGSIREVTDSNGNLVSQFDYDPWGNQVVLSGNMSVDFGYAGMYYHTRSGLNLTMYRAYNPTFGRWISRDPLPNAEVSEGSNLYAYVGNDPIDDGDPLGLTDFNSTDTRRLLLRAIADATEGPLEGLENIKSNSQGDFDFKGSGDTFCLNGIRLGDAAFGNFIAGFAAQAYDQTFGGSSALTAVLTYGVAYHVKGYFKLENDFGDILDGSGRPAILAGARAALSYPQSVRSTRGSTQDCKCQ